MYKNTGKHSLNSSIIVCSWFSGNQNSIDHVYIRLYTLSKYPFLHKNIYDIVSPLQYQIEWSSWQNSHNLIEKRVYCWCVYLLRYLIVLPYLQRFRCFDINSLHEFVYIVKSRLWYFYSVKFIRSHVPFLRVWIYYECECDMLWGSQWMMCVNVSYLGEGARVT